MNEINLVLKISGTKQNINEVLEYLEAKYYIVFTSGYQQNSDDKGFHRYFNLIPKVMVKTET